MSKSAKFYITDFREFYNVVNSPIRGKEDIIKVLLLSIKNLLINYNNKDEGKGEVIINIDKSSRIYFVCKQVGELPSKYYSFVFPFSLQEESEGKFIVRCRTSLEKIDSELIDQLLNLVDKGWFSDGNINSDNIDKFACDFLEAIDDYYIIKGINTEEKNNNTYVAHWSIIKTLLTFEPSYVRYDYDPKYEDGDKHPLHHLDVHYTSNGTFKLGFDSSINIKERLDFNIFKDILENGKEREDICYKIK